MTGSNIRNSGASHVSGRVSNASQKPEDTGIVGRNAESVNFIFTWPVNTLGKSPVDPEQMLEILLTLGGLSVVWPGLHMG